MLRLFPPSGSDRLLLHSCCAPCSGAVIECLLSNGLRPTVFFSNSNIVPKEEYLLRLKELKRYCDSFGLQTVEDDYDHLSWLSCTKGLENEKERGLRCTQCFLFRLRRAARYASRNGYKVLATTLASSRWKDFSQVNEAGISACSDETLRSGVEVTFWAQDWRKGGLQPRRSEIIREQNFYNQLYCGCEFSKKSSE